MMYWLLLLLILFTAVIYLLLAPFYLEIDSTKDLVRARFHRVATAGLILGDRTLLLDVKVPGWRKKIDLFEKRRERTPPKKIKQTNKPRSFSLSKMTTVLRSFKITRFELNLDSGNAAMNGMLYPVFYQVGRLSGKNIRINFTGENVVMITIENNIARILWAFLFTSSTSIYSPLKNKIP